MKKLVLGSLLLAALASQTTGCIITDDEEPPPPDEFATITGEWSFHTVNPQGALSPANSCPVGFGTVALHNQELDSQDRPIGEPFVDLFDCARFTGLTDELPPGVFETFISVTNADGTSIYAESLAAIVDVTVVDKTFKAQIVDNGGYFKVAWTLRRNNQTIACRDVVGLDGVEITSTIAGSSAGVVDTFDCDLGFDFSAPVLEGNYVVTVDAVDTTGGAIGTGALLNNRVMRNRNQVTDLGTVTLTF